MTTFTGPRDVDGEVEHGHALGDAAWAAGVDHVVYSSVGGPERADLVTELGEPTPTLDLPTPELPVSDPARSQETSQAHGISTA